MKANRAARSVDQPGQDEAVSPVIGTVLMLAVSAIGMTVVAYWGLPVLQRLRDQAGLQTMTNQMERVHAALSGLSGSGDARSLAITLPSGELDVVRSGRIQVAIDHDTYPLFAGAACDFHVTGWNDPAFTGTFAYTATGCRTPRFVIPPVVCEPVFGNICIGGLLPTESVLEAYQVDGARLVGVTTAPGAGTFTVAAYSADHDWMFRLTNGDHDPSGNLQVYAEAWLLRSDAIAWRHATSASDLEVATHMGGLFVRGQGTSFADRALDVDEDVGALGGGAYLLRLPTLTSPAEGGFNDGAQHTLELSYIQGIARTRLDGDPATDASGQVATRLRFDFDGPLAGAECTSLLQRSPRYQEDQAPATVYPCDVGDATGLRSITYTVPSPTLPGTTVPFQMRLQHDRIQAETRL